MKEIQPLYVDGKLRCHQNCPSMGMEDAPDGCTQCAPGEYCIPAVLRNAEESQSLLKTALDMVEKEEWNSNLMEPLLSVLRGEEPWVSCTKICPNCGPSIKVFDGDTKVLYCGKCKHVFSKKG